MSNMNPPLLKLGWLVGGVFAGLSLYVAFTGYGTASGPTVSGVVRSVDLLPAHGGPRGTTSTVGTVPGSLAASSSKKLIEIQSSSPVLDYSEGSQQLTEVGSANASVGSSAESSETPKPTSTTSDKASTNTSAASSDVASSGGSQDVSPVQSLSGTDNKTTSTTDLNSPTSTTGATSTTASTTTSTTAGRSDANSSNGGDD